MGFKWYTESVKFEYLGFDIIPETYNNVDHGQRFFTELWKTWDK